MTAKSLITLLKVFYIENYFLDTRTWFSYLLSHVFFLLRGSQAEAEKPNKKAIWCPVYSVWILPVPSLASLLSSNNHHECNCWAGCPCKCHQHPRQEFLCQYLLFWGQNQPNSKHQQLASRRLALAVAEEKRQKNWKNIMVRKIPFYFKR